MIKKFINTIYYLFYDLLKILINLQKKNNFIILLPRSLAIFSKKIFIYDKLNKKYFIQSIRNKYDALTVFEIFGEESYCLTKLKKWKKINKKYKNILEKKLKPLIIDCGSNIGCSTEYFYRIFSEAKFLSLEPNYECINFSKQNISPSDVVLINKAVSSEHQNLFIDLDKDDSRASKISKKQGIEIESISINSLINEHKLYTPFIIKIDIEGFENDLFSKNYEWINSFDVLIIEIHDWMLPGRSNSYNFFKAIAENMNIDSKRDIIISGENLILIKNDE